MTLPPGMNRHGNKNLDNHGHGHVELDDNELEQGHGDGHLVGHTDGHGDLHLHNESDDGHVKDEEIDIVRQTNGHGKTENKERHRYEHVDSQEDEHHEDDLDHKEDDEHQGEAEQHSDASHRKNRINRADRLEDNFRPVQPLNGRHILDVDTSVKHFKEATIVDHSERSIAHRLRGSGHTETAGKDTNLTFLHGSGGKEEHTSEANHRQSIHSSGMVENSGKAENDGNDVTFIHTSGKEGSAEHKTGKSGYAIHRAGTAGRDGNIAFRTGIKSARYQSNEADPIESLSRTVLIFCLVIILEPIL